jgi:serine/threonine protein kinase
MDDRAIDIARRVLQRPVSERDAFLEGACGDNPPLRKQVDDALRRMQDAQTAAARSSGNDMPTAVFAPSAHAPAGRTATVSGGEFVEGAGSIIGHYKILQLIGEGGFGNVYMAQQSEPVKRRVALKIVKPGMDTKQVIGRFESERQALAMMDHPNIARVYDAGTTSTGRPYFVMELVKGVPITEYCDSAQLSTRERLELFISVCQAVQHAHLKGIVHRDIKPSNVLVTLHDEKPVVKVIDFGIAKAMNQDLTTSTVFTEFKQFIGTPEYMSPEQAAMSGLDVDSRTDIYSLGVLLYELMSGSTPFSSEELRSAGMAEIARKIKEDEPLRPSTRVTLASKIGSGSGEAKPPSATGGPKSTTAEQIAKHRRTDIGTLRRQLAGDLDWIVMKAMEKDRSRRYETSSALADDIRRFLANEPILARPPSTVYRLRKFARRNRVGFAASAGVVAAVLLTLIALAYGLSEARTERDRTVQHETETRAKMLLSSMNAIRTYTADNVRPALAVLASGNKDAKTPDYNAHFVREMVPGFSARQVFANFRDAKRPDGTPGPYANFIYKEASPNPTNHDNLADDFEKTLVEKFKADPKLPELSNTVDRAGLGGAVYYIARPMVIKDAKCIDCHNTVETAPPGQIEMYGKDGWKGGYGWKMGDVVAAQIVYVPVAHGFDNPSGVLNKVLIAAAAVLLLGGIGSLVMLRRA